MNRDLRFRVWCKDYNEWEKDYCFLSQNGVPYQVLKGGRIVAIRPENHIVQFYTGLNDKNGKAIYDGDIITCPQFTLEEAFVGVVEFWNCAWTAYEGKYQVRLQLGVGLKYEILGNIFENPELLKQ